MTAAEFLSACASFARRHPAAVLEMERPELAVDCRASAHHLRTTVVAARKRMTTTAKLALRPAEANLPTLFDHRIREDA